MTLTEVLRAAWLASFTTRGNFARENAELVAMAKSGFVFFNYKLGKVVQMPATFSDKFSKVNWLSK